MSLFDKMYKCLTFFREEFKNHDLLEIVDHFFGKDVDFKKKVFEIIFNFLFDNWINKKNKKSIEFSNHRKLKTKRIKVVATSNIIKALKKYNMFAINSQIFPIFFIDTGEKAVFIQFIGKWIADHIDIDKINNEYDLLIEFKKMCESSVFTQNLNTIYDLMKEYPFGQNILNFLESLKNEESLTQYISYLKNIIKKNNSDNHENGEDEVFDDENTPKRPKK